MKAHEKDKIIRRYSDRLKEFGANEKALGWDKKRHHLRYNILLSQWSFENDSLLDFGCGFGDMHGYIHENNLNLNYNGVDINPDLIEEGKNKYRNVNLRALDFLSEQNNEQYDYLVSSGVHNFKLEDNWEFIKNTFVKFNDSAKKGFALNFISNKVDESHKKDHLYYADPSLLLGLAYSFSRKVVLRNDYMPFEFTIFVNKEDDFDKDKVVYHEYVKYCK
jgi:hypothetical protein